MQEHLFHIIEVAQVTCLKSQVYREHASEVRIIMFIQDNQKIFKNSIKMTIKPLLFDEITF